MALAAFESAEDLQAVPAISAPSFFRVQVQQRRRLSFIPHVSTARLLGPSNIVFVDITVLRGLLSYLHVIFVQYCV